MSRRFALAPVVVAIVAFAAPAQAAPGALNVLVTGNCGYETDLATEIAAQPGVVSATPIDTSAGTPTAAELAGSDVVVSVGDSCAGYLDAALWGDGLADYVDAGGAVVQMAYDNWDDPTAHPLGRFASGGYPPLLLGPNDNLSVTLGERLVPNSPILQGVPDFTSDSNTTTPLAAGATLLAKWSDGRNAVAIQGRVVSTSASPGDSGARPGLAQIAVNAGNYIRDYALAVTKSGSGTGTVTSSPPGISCGSACSSNFHFGTRVALTATPAPGSSFSGWGGDCSGAASPCTVTVDAARNVTATFTANPPPPPPTAGPALFRLLSRTVPIKLRTGRGSQRAKCNNLATDRCAIVLTLRARAAGKRVKVGSARGTIAGDKVGRLRFKLNRRGLRMLRHNRRHRLRVTATGSSTNKLAQSTKVTRKLTLKGKR
jgi:Divergent InlB B-repeat domain